MQEQTWFYSLGKILSETEEAKLQMLLQTFFQNWLSHGTPVKGNFTIRYHRFVIVQANSEMTKPSGCSIDSMRNAVEGCIAKVGANLVDASYVFYRNTHNEICSLHFSKLKEAFDKGLLTSKTIVFDHSLNWSDDLEKWEVPLENTWLKRYLPTLV